MRTDRIPNGLWGSSPAAAVNVRKTHCVHGHEFTPENTYWDADRAGRHCRACALARAAEKNERIRRERLASHPDAIVWPKLPPGATPMDRVRARTTRTETCWLVPAHRTGYGHVSVGGDRNRASHIVAWEAASGAPVPPGMFVCHVCDVRNCVRNDEEGVYVFEGIAYRRFGHLFLAPPSVNTKDMWRKGRAKPDNGVHAPKGTAHWNARLDDETVREIRRLAATHTQAAVCRLLGLPAVTVSNVVNHKTWRHVA